MASGQQANPNYLHHLGSTGPPDRDSSLDHFLIDFNELEPGNVRPVPISVFQRLFDEHFEPALVARKWLIDGLEEYRRLEKTDRPAERRRLRDTKDLSLITKDAFDEVIKRITRVVADAATRVQWDKGHGNYGEELQEWLQEKYSKLDQNVVDNESFPIKSELELIQGFIAQAMMVVPLAWGNGQAENSAKRPLSGNDGGGNDGGGDDGGPPPKKLRSRLSPGSWWGSNKSKLACTEKFFEVIDQYKAYLANPADEPGTLKHRRQMEDFLRRALAEVNMSSRYNDLVLKKEWNFRDKECGVARTPSFIQPGAGEATWRLGTEGCLGFNDFKAMLGGGLSEVEKLKSNNITAHTLGMLALSTSLSPKRVSLRGGAQNDADGGNQEETIEDENEAKRRKIRTGLNIRFREPNLLWEQLQEDVTFPGRDFQARFDAWRPPMTDPDHAGKVLSLFKIVLPKALEPEEWNNLQTENNLSQLRSMAGRYREIVAESRRKARDFIYNNPEKISLGEPKLEEGGGMDRPKSRYSNLRSKDFAKPLGHAVRARMFQLLLMSIYWRLYLLEIHTLQEYLEEERVNLEIWIEHEELFMEWENNRWFELSNEREMEELRLRYAGRGFVCHEWESEIKSIDEAIKALDEDPACFDNPSGPGEANVQPVHPSPEQSHDEVLKALQSLEPEAIVADLQKDSDANIDWTTIGRMVNHRAVNIGADILERAVHAYEEKLEQLIGKNNNLNGRDPANAALIARNNRDIAAQQQIIRSLRAEKDNLKRSLDPVLDASISDGMRHTLELPRDEAYRTHTRGVTSRPLPLGVTSLGLGPMPGESPTPWDYRILVGAPKDFGQKRSFPGDNMVGLRGVVGSATGPSPDKPRTGENNTPSQALLERFRKIIRNMNESELIARRMAQVMNTKGLLNQDQQNAMHRALILKDKCLEQIEIMRNEADEAIRAQVDLIEQEEDSILKAGLEALGEIKDHASDRGRATHDAAQKEHATNGKPSQPVGQQPVPRTPARRRVRLHTSPNSRPSGELPKLPQFPDLPAGSADQAADNSAFMEQAKKDYAEAHERYETMKKLREESAERVTATRRTAQETDEPVLRELADVVETQKFIEDKSYIDSAVKLRLIGEALMAQRKWADPPETAEQLQERYDNVNKDFEVWKSEYDWGDWEMTPKATNDMWVVEVTAMMHEAWKILGVNPGPKYWHDMYESFWKGKGNTLERKRKIWLYMLVSDLNRKILQLNGSVRSFIKTPPMPPQMGAEGTPDIEDLLRQASAQPAPKPALMKTTSPYTPSRPANQNPAPFPRSESKQPAELAPIASSEQQQRGLEQQVPKQKESWQQQVEQQQLRQQRLQHQELQQQKKQQQKKPQQKKQQQERRPPSIRQQQLQQQRLQQQEAQTLQKQRLRQQKLQQKQLQEYRNQQQQRQQQQQPLPPLPPPPQPRGYQQQQQQQQIPQEYHQQLQQQQQQKESRPPKTPTTPKKPEKPKAATKPKDRARPATITTTMDETNDAWPDLKDLLQATWNAILAHEVLQQRHGNKSKYAQAGRPLWPVPVPKKRYASL